MTPLHPPHTPPPEIHHLTPGQMIIAAIMIFLVLWVAYSIGKVILRVVAGLIFLALACYGIWYLFIR